MKLMAIQSCCTFYRIFKDVCRCFGAEKETITDIIVGRNDRVDEQIHKLEKFLDEIKNRISTWMTVVNENATLRMSGNQSGGTLPFDVFAAPGSCSWCRQRFSGHFYEG